MTGEIRDKVTSNKNVPPQVIYEGRPLGGQLARVVEFTDEEDGRRRIAVEVAETDSMNQRRWIEAKYPQKGIVLEHALMAFAETLRAPNTYEKEYDR